MLSLNQLKIIKALTTKRYRQKYNKFIAEGVKVCEEILRVSNYRVEQIYYTKEWENATQAFPAQAEARFTGISVEEMAQISALATPSPILAVLTLPPNLVELPKALGKAHVLVLDGIRDPGNLGTMLRIADWFGIEYVVCSPDCVDVYSPKVIQACMGSFLRVQHYEQDLTLLFETFPKVPVYGAVLNGESLFSTNWEPRGFIVIGNESEGIRPAVEPFLTHRIAIPAYGGAESLNAAVATGIILASLRQTHAH